MNPITHDLIDNLEPHLDSFEEITFPDTDSQQHLLLESLHYVQKIDVRDTDYSVRAGVEFHGVTQQRINHYDDIVDVIAEAIPPVQEQLTVQHRESPGGHPGIWCHFNYTTSEHTITHEEPALGEHTLQQKQTTREAYKQSKQYLPDVAKQSTRAKPERRLEDTTLTETIEPQHTLTDKLHKHKDDLSKFLDAYITHLQR